MACPSSGALSLASIRGEIENNSYAAYTSAATSLESASEGTYDTINTNNDAADRPDGNDPHAMSEFYSYDHDKSSSGNWAAYTLVYKSGKFSDCSGVCGGSGSNVTVHVLNGGGSVQSIFDNDETIYSSSSGGSPPLAASGWYAEGTSTGDECGKWSNSGSGSWVSGLQGQCGQ